MDDITPNEGSELPSSEMIVNSIQDATGARYLMNQLWPLRSSLPLLPAGALCFLVPLKIINRITKILKPETFFTQ